MIFIDPSELRETSNLKKFISDVVYRPLPDLEAVTGADVMISPSGLPLPLSEELIRLHIRKGAKLIQIKFGHDLSSSVIDGRLNEALHRMKSCDTKYWQRLLLFIGIFSYDKTNKMAVINGQLTHGVAMKWRSIRSALNSWIERGGAVEFPLSTGKLVPLHFSIHQAHIDSFVDGRPKIIHLKPPTFYERIEPKNPYLKQFEEAQKIVAVNDIRRIFCAIPDVKIGPVKATAILDYMQENDIRQDLTGFLEMIKGDKPEILNVPGIGKKLAEKINLGLYKTREERERK